MTALLLTDDEHRAVDLLGQVADLMGRIVGHDLSRQGDMAEVGAHVHVLQRMVLAQAAARAYPDRYRRLGERIRS